MGIRFIQHGRCRNFGGVSVLPKRFACLKIENGHTNFGDEDVLRSDVSALTSCCKQNGIGEFRFAASFAACRLRFGAVTGESRFLSNSAASALRLRIIGGGEVPFIFAYKSKGLVAFAKALSNRTRCASIA